MMRIRLISFAGLLVPVMIVPVARAQLRVTPASVNVNTQGATTVFLTYGGMRSDQASSEAVWCARVISAAPDVGVRCDPATVWGSLPQRYDRSQNSGVNGFTDIMSIPASIGRRAYQSAKGGDESSFYYVRRFVSSIGLPDEYVFVNCRLAGGGADVPLSLTNVTLDFAVETPVLFVRPGERPPPLSAKITYTGTGQLAGRWEVVRPGEELPDDTDLLTEATLPEEERGSQRRYTQLERFNIFLPPSGKITLPGPDVSRLPTDVDGSYLVLLRVEATDDGAGDSNLASVGAGTGIVKTGAVAGFPLPTLRYVVGAGESGLAEPARRQALTQLLPRPDTVLDRAGRVRFTWLDSPGAAFHRLEIKRADGQPVHSAIIARGVGMYVAPPWIAERAGADSVTWRIVALDANGRERGTSGWRRLKFGETPPRT